MILNPYRFGAGGPPIGSSTRWRLRFPTGGSSNATMPSFVEVFEIEMRAGTGGADLCTGGTATASTGTAANAFDNNSAGTFWACTSGNAKNSWLEYEFLSAVSIVEVGVWARSSGPGPTSFALEYWDGADWQTSFVVSPITWSGSVAEQSFTAADGFVPSGHTNWRILITTGSTSAYCRIVEIQMRRVAGGADLCRGILATAFNSAASAPVNNAFDNGVNVWASNQPVAGAAGNWVEVEFPYALDIAEITVASDSSAERPPRGMDFQYYDDDLASWVTKWGVASLSWSGTETKTFTAP